MSDPMMTAILALAVSQALLVVYALVRPGRPGPKGDTGPCGPMGMMGEPGKPGVCRCEKDAGVDFRRTAAEATRYRAVVHWDDREVIGYGPHRVTASMAERDGLECVDRHGANWYTVERWTASRGWHELED